MHTLLRRDSHVIALSFWEEFLTKTSTLASSRSCRATGGCPKYNTELYISQEPKGPNFMLHDTDLLKAKYHFVFLFFLKGSGRLFPPCFLRIIMTLLQRNKGFHSSLIMLIMDYMKIIILEKGGGLPILARYILELQLYKAGSRKFKPYVYGNSLNCPRECSSNPSVLSSSHTNLS